MGHRSYLYINKNEGNLPAFEANNSLPFFWISLIDLITFEKKAQDWQTFETYATTHNEEEIDQYLNNNSLSIQLDYQTFEKNASQTSVFLAAHFPETIPLYNSFIETLKNHFAKEDKLELEITQLSSFYETLEEYILILKKEINAIQQNKPEDITFLDLNDLIYSGTGFESTSLKEFTESPAYQAAIKNKKKAPLQKTTTPNPKYNRNLLILSIVILLVSPVFTYSLLKGIQKEAFSLTVITIGISNIIWYLIGFFGIKGQIKASKNEKRG